MTVVEPLISIVLVVGNRRERAAHMLASVLTQEGLDSAEVILFDVATNNALPLPGSDQPLVKLIRRERRESFGELRAEGARLARGKYVAFLEEHCRAMPGWLKATTNALAGPWAGASGEVQNATMGKGISDAVGVMNYLPDWRPPARYGPSKSLPGQNAAYKREVLLALQNDLPVMMQNEVLFVRGHDIVNTRCTGITCNWVTTS